MEKFSITTHYQQCLPHLKRKEVYDKVYKHMQTEQKVYGKHEAEVIHQNSNSGVKSKDTASNCEGKYSLDETKS